MKAENRNHCNWYHITLPSGPRHPRVCFKSITWYIKMHQVKAFFSARRRDCLVLRDVHSQHVYLQEESLKNRSEFLLIICYLELINSSHADSSMADKNRLRSERSGFEPWPGTCVVFLEKTLYSHGASLHPGV